MSFESDPWSTPGKPSPSTSKGFDAWGDSAWGETTTPAASTTGFGDAWGETSSWGSEVAVQPEKPESKSSLGAAVENGWGVTDGVKGDIQSAWGNRGEIASAGRDYAVGAGMEVGKQGLNAALDVLKKDTGVSFETNENGERELTIRKGKLAKFAIKAVFTLGGSVANTGRKAAVAGVKGARKETVSQVKTARSQVVSAGKSYAAAQVGW